MISVLFGIVVGAAFALWWAYDQWGRPLREHEIYNEACRMYNAHVVEQRNQQAAREASAQ